jgi:hypothetical protein
VRVNGLYINAWIYQKVLYCKQRFKKSCLTYFSDGQTKITVVHVVSLAAALFRVDLVGNTELQFFVGRMAFISNNGCPLRCFVVVSHTFTRHVKSRVGKSS